MDKDYEALIMKHEQTLYGTPEQKGIVGKIEELYEWFLQSRGKNSVIMFVKDLLISGGIIAVLVTWIITK